MKTPQRQGAEEEGEPEGEVKFMDESKLALAAGLMRSVVDEARISPAITKFELADIDNGRYRLTFEMAGEDCIVPSENASNQR